MIGEWYLNDGLINTGNPDTSNKIPIEESLRHPNYAPYGFEIKTDSIYYFLGIWRKESNNLKYIGNCRHYEIKNDSLIVFDSIDVIYRAYKISTPSPDTLILNNNGKASTFIRFQSTIKKYHKIDSIFIHSGNGWGKDIRYSVSNKRTITFKDYSHQNNTINKISKKWEITQDEFNMIERKYNIANFADLDDNYGGGKDADYCRIQIFYDTNKCKIIFDYMNASPMKLIWANRCLMNLIESKK